MSSMLSRAIGPSFEALCELQGGVLIWKAAPGRDFEFKGVVKTVSQILPQSILYPKPEQKVVIKAARRKFLEFGFEPTTGSTFEGEFVDYRVDQMPPAHDASMITFVCTAVSKKR